MKKNIDDTSRDSPPPARGRAGLVCLAAILMLVICPLGFAQSCQAGPYEPSPRAASLGEDLLPVEKLEGDGIYVMPVFAQIFSQRQDFPAVIWFDEQFLGDGGGYLRRAKGEFADETRRSLRSKTVATLKALADRSWARAELDLEPLQAAGDLKNINRHWVINGFSCDLTAAGLEALQGVPGVKKIFAKLDGGQPRPGLMAKVAPPLPELAFDPHAFKHPWYTRYLMADKVWEKFGATGKGTLNVVHDFDFAFLPNITRSMYRNPKEVPGDGKDNDGNGLVDDYHGWHFGSDSAKLWADQENTHGSQCAGVICAQGVAGKEVEFGLAPEATWAPLVKGRDIEDPVEWAIEHGADTYSMSFSLPGFGNYRSHWRKVMEHGSFCGVYFVSGAGNFAQEGTRAFAPVPVQMRTPEDIPEVVFAAAGVGRDFVRPPFSSQGPVEWNLEHYRDGRVQKPEVMAFNFRVPTMTPAGDVAPQPISGNSFAGPMFCGSISILLSADPELLPWDLKAVITSTATDVAAPGIDFQTGYGLINLFRATKEVLRRKAVREGNDPKPYEGREAGDEINVGSIPAAPGITRVVENSKAAAIGLKAGDLLVSIQGEPISATAEFRAAREKAAGDGLAEVGLVVRRDGGELKFKVPASGLLGVDVGILFTEPAFQ